MKWSFFRRYYGIFAVSLQDVFQSRSISAVWFMLSILNSSSVLLLWAAGFANKTISGTITLPTIELYYVLLLFGGQVLMSHVEETVARYDIKEGGLSKYLIRPISYFWFRFWAELPWRISGLVFSSLAFIVFVTVLHLRLPTLTLLSLPFIVVTLSLALLLSFTYKMLLSLSAFWITEGWALFEVMDSIVILLAGFVLPLTLFPGSVQKILFSLPFAYMIFVPLQSILGNESIAQITHGISVQVFWIVILGLVYRILWKRGVSLFTGIGQ